jgi:hypothetical protein
MSRGDHTSHIIARGFERDEGGDGIRRRALDAVDVDAPKRRRSGSRSA